MLLSLQITEDGTYIESCFANDRPIGQILIVKEDGTYFEGSIEGKGFAGIFRNPTKNRISNNAKDPDRSSRLCLGKGVFGYKYTISNGLRYKGELSKGIALDNQQDLQVKSE